MQLSHIVLLAIVQSEKVLSFPCEAKYTTAGWCARQPNATAWTEPYAGLEDALMAGSATTSTPVAPFVHIVLSVDMKVRRGRMEQFHYEAKRGDNGWRAHVAHREDWTRPHGGLEDALITAAKLSKAGQIKAAA